MAGDAEPEFIRYLRDQFRSWAPVEIRRMFGGHGIFRDGLMFALIHDETVYLRSDETSRPDFAAAGMAPFRYRRKGRLVALGYHQAPPETLEDAEAMANGRIALLRPRCGARHRDRGVRQAEQPARPERSFPGE